MIEFLLRKTWKGDFILNYKLYGTWMLHEMVESHSIAPVNDINYKPVSTCEFIHLRLIKLLDSITFSISPLLFGGKFLIPEAFFSKLNDLIIYNPVGAVLAIKTYMRSWPEKSAS